MKEKTAHTTHNKYKGDRAIAEPLLNFPSASSRRQPAPLPARSPGPALPCPARRLHGPGGAEPPGSAHLTGIGESGAGAAAGAEANFRETSERKVKESPRLRQQHLVPPPRPTRPGPGAPRTAPRPPRQREKFRGGGSGGAGRRVPGNLPTAAGPRRRRGRGER